MLSLIKTIREKLRVKADIKRMIKNNIPCQTIPNHPYWKDRSNIGR